MNHIKKKYTLGKDERLKSRKQLEQLFRSGQTFFVHPFKVYYAFAGGESSMMVVTDERANDAKKARSNDEHANNARSNGERTNNARSNNAGPDNERANGAGAVPLKAAFGVSARVFKKSVDRNRVKRLMREAYRLQKLVLAAEVEKSGKHMVIFFLYTGKELPRYGLIAEKMAVVLERLMKMAVNEGSTKK